ncbi:protein sumv-2 [Ditylenchus destructor]|uniref:Protein sumv-2 n=1 Tax=Ditylenchus destructor TaxID=166010 RepID=A0AAD4MKT0_9BILA|nr:protein sumv-2 [Ditylenchus destructor]
MGRKKLDLTEKEKKAKMNGTNTCQKVEKQTARRSKSGVQNETVLKKKQPARRLKSSVQPNVTLMKEKNHFQNVEKQPARRSKSGVQPKAIMDEAHETNTLQSVKKQSARRSNSVWHSEAIQLSEQTSDATNFQKAEKQSSRRLKTGLQPQVLMENIQEMNASDKVNMQADRNVDSELYSESTTIPNVTEYIDQTETTQIFYTGGIPARDEYIQLAEANNVIFESRRNFAEKMRLRSKLNSMSIGLNTVVIDKDDYFCRKLLTNYYSPRNSAFSDRHSDDYFIDVCSQNEPVISSECALGWSPAELCAKDIVNVVNQSKRLSSVEELEESAHLEDPEVESLLKAFLKNIFIQRSIALSTLSVAAGTSMFYSLSLDNANHLVESLCLFNENSLTSFVNAHRWLLLNLDKYLLSAYLNLLKFCDLTGSKLVMYLINTSMNQNDEPMNLGNKYLLEFLRGKIEDPAITWLSTIKQHQIENVTLIFVYPLNFVPQTPNPCNSLFSDLLPQVAAHVERILLPPKADAYQTVESYTMKCIRVIYWHLRRIKDSRPNDYIFLVGWRTSCLLNHYVLSHLEGITGVLDFAFPLQTVYGPRGDVEDDICMTPCSTLFVIGEDACDTDAISMADLRTNMLYDTGLIVVGSADQNLLVAAPRLSIERITQKCVDWSVMYHVSDFIRKVVGNFPYPDIEVNFRHAHPSSKSLEINFAEKEMMAKAPRKYIRKKVLREIQNDPPIESQSEERVGSKNRKSVSGNTKRKQSPRKLQVKYTPETI